MSSPSPPTANNIIRCHCFLFHTCSLGVNPLGDDGLLVLAEGIKNCKELKDLK